MKKHLILCATAAILTLSIGLSACSGGGEEEEHQWVSTTTATCGEAGITTYTCEIHNDSYTEETPATGAHTYNGEVCSVCGYVNFSNMTVAEGIAKYGYYVEDNDGSKTYTTGDTVYFGSYPQNLVETASAPAGAKAAFSAAEASLPTADNAGGWTSYGYYKDGEVADYMFYMDVEADGTKYRGVYMLDYRPYYSYFAANEDNTYIAGHGYELNRVYWFEYSPIAWNVLSYADGELFLNAEYCLDAQPFQEVYEEGEDGSYLIPGTQAYVNNWEYSTIRSFLNEEFYQLAFSESQQALIQTAALDNKTTGATTSEYNNTEDKVFLLSYQDTSNEAYGYTSSGNSRRRTFSEYSAVQGLRSSSQTTTADGDPCCFYLLRSEGSLTYSSYGISKYGATAETSATIDTINTETDAEDGYSLNGDAGVLPALYIRVGKSASGVWKENTYQYTDTEGEAAEITYLLYIPSSYTGGQSLPLITYIPDSTYVNGSATLYKGGACFTNWATEEKMAQNPAFFLTVLFSAPDSDVTVEGSEVAQVVPIINKVVEQYGMDTDRLYLTGQSMGGIMDFAINSAYPDMFAATVYVGCQPGGEVNDDQYVKLIEQAEFMNQTFVYIASRKDEKAPYGQDDVEQVLIDNNVEYAKLYDLDHNDATALNTAVKAVLDQGYARNFFGFTQLTGTGEGAAEHMRSFNYCYSIDCIFEWLMAQSK